MKQSDVDILIEICELMQLAHRVPLEIIPSIHTQIKVLADELDEKGIAAIRDTTEWRSAVLAWKWLYCELEHDLISEWQQFFAEQKTKEGI